MAQMGQTDTQRDVTEHITTMHLHVMKTQQLQKLKN